MSKNLESKNNVGATNQVMRRVLFDGEPSGTPKIMFIGNSITRHEPAPAIGWCHDHGMAASKKENDYVHLVMQGVREKYPRATFCIVQAAVWETRYTDCPLDEHFADAKGFMPDYILCAISANIPAEKFEHDAFIRQMGALHSYLKDGASPKILQSTSFFNNPEKTRAIRDYVKECCGVVVEISDISADEENLAIGKFEHRGIQYHPGDAGMRKIADRFLEKLLPLLDGKK